MERPTQPLRVLQLNSMFSGGGVDNQTLELSQALQERGHLITLAVAAGSRWEPRAQALSPGIRVESFPGKSPLRSALMRTVIRLLRRDRCQILHLHQGRDYWPGIIAAKLAFCSTRVVITRHLMTRPRGFSRRFLLRMAHILPVSQAVQRVLESELIGDHRRIHHVPGGIDIDQFKPLREADGEAIRRQHHWSTEHVVFGVVGMYEPPRGKGQFEFLQAAVRVLKLHPNARFVLVGQGGLRSEIEQFLAREHITDRVTLTGFAENMPAVMSALDVLVHPTTGTEAFPLVILEAMASAKPVIASNLDGIPEQITEGQEGFLVPKTDVAALAERMSQLARDPELRSRMGQRGRQRVSHHFTRHHLGENTERIYRAIL